MWLDKGLLAFVVLLVPAIGSAQVEQSGCELTASKLGARYTVTRHTGADEAQVRESRVEIWRRSRQVAYVYQDAEITDIWDLVVDGRQKLIRYFDAYDRAIEYQPEDVQAGVGEDAWSERNQLVSDALRRELTYVDARGTGCDLIQRFEGTLDGVVYELEWRPGVNLAETFSRRNETDSEFWRLDALVVDPGEVDDQFTTRSRYQTTDFVDIGDNESDPFLRQVMNLGFIHRAHVH